MALSRLMGDSFLSSVAQGNSWKLRVLLAGAVESTTDLPIISSDALLLSKRRRLGRGSPSLTKVTWQLLQNLTSAEIVELVRAKNEAQKVITKTERVQAYH